MQAYRSLLFVPALNERALEKSKGLGCDAVILDLEDSIPFDRKDEARDAAISALQGGGFAAPMQMVRVNGAASDTFKSDVSSLAKIGIKAILVPKVENAEDVQAIARILDAEPAAKDTQIWFMIESALGVLNLREICAVSPRLVGMIVGPNDLIKDLNARATTGQEALLTSFGLCLLAGRAHGLVCIDGIYKHFKDMEGFAANCTMGRDLGFDGKSLIHPAQIEPANAAFGPSQESLELAKRHVAAFEEARADGKGIATVDGEMVEKMHVEVARELLVMADTLAKREGE